MVLTCNHVNFCDENVFLCQKAEIVRMEQYAVFLSNKKVTVMSVIEKYQQ